MNEVIREQSDKRDAKSQKKRSTVSAAVVKQYLQENPDFFDHYPELLGDLHLPSLHNNAQIGSLNKRQLGVLRERQKESTRKLGEFLDNANDNQQLIEQSKHYVLTLLNARSAKSILETIKTSLKEEFGVEYASVQPWNAEAEAEAYSLLKRFVVDNGQQNDSFTGAIREHESQLIFGHGDAKSCVAICRAPDSEQNFPGIALAVGSSDADFYFQGIGTDILEFLVDVAVRSLARCL